MQIESLIIQRMNEFGVKLEGSLVKDSSDEARFFIFIASKREADGSENPSTKRLKQIEILLQEELKITIEFIKISEDLEFIINALRMQMINLHGNEISNIIISTSKKMAFVWIVPRVAAVALEKLSELEKTSRSLLRAFGLQLGGVYLVHTASVPGHLACLNVVRFSSPADLEKISISLRKKGFIVPTDEWLNGKLDLLRKGEFIVRFKDGKYALTLNGLTLLGSGRGRGSPDLSRVLALAQGKS